MRDKLFRGLDCGWENGIQEIDEALSMGCILVVEVDSIVFFGNLEDLVIGSMLENELFDEIEGFLMVDVLSDLDDSSPGVRGELFLAVVALHVALNELCDEGLLDFCFVVQLFLDSDFDLYAFGVAFSPDEACVDDFGFIEPLDLLEQNGEQLLAVPVACHPWRSHVSVAESAEIDDGFFGNADGDVSLGKHAGLADIGEGGLELDATHWAKNGGFMFNLHHC